MVHSQSAETGKVDTDTESHQQRHEARSEETKRFFASLEAGERNLSQHCEKDKEIANEYRNAGKDTHFSNDSVKIAYNYHRRQHNAARENSYK